MSALARQFVVVSSSLRNLKIPQLTSVIARIDRRSCGRETTFRASSMWGGGWCVMIIFPRCFVYINISRLLYRATHNVHSLLLMM